MQGEDAAKGTAPKKARFVPKIPVRKTKTARTKVEPSEPTKENIIDKELLAKLNSAKSEDAFGRRKFERKSGPVEVAFGHGISSSIRSFGITKLGDGSEQAPKEYIEPWDYAHSYYPVSLPLRKPYSGDPEILDRVEFGEDSTSQGCTTSIPPAQELGFMDESSEPQMLLFQFPSVLPLAKELLTDVVKNVDDVKRETPNSGKKGISKPGATAPDNHKSDSKPAGASNKSNRAGGLKDLKPGYLGKMIVYKSGKVKMKIGDVLFDVGPGQNCVFAQELAAINVKEKHCCVLGDLQKLAVVTPDVDSLLESIENL